MGRIECRDIGDDNVLFLSDRLCFQSVSAHFHREDQLVLGREDKKCHLIKQKAFRRFIIGRPPRENSDISIGDAVNWEWLVACATAHNAELVVVSRDSDYGITIDGTSLINDHLAQEFSGRVSKRRKVTLFAKLSGAVKHWNVQSLLNKRKRSKNWRVPL